MVALCSGIITVAISRTTHTPPYPRRPSTLLHPQKLRHTKGPPACCSTACLRPPPLPCVPTNPAAPLSAAVAAVNSFHVHSFPRRTVLLATAPSHPRTFHLAHLPCRQPCLLRAESERDEPESAATPYRRCLRFRLVDPPLTRSSGAALQSAPSPIPIAYLAREAAAAAAASTTTQHSRCHCPPRRISPWRGKWCCTNWWCSGMVAWERLL